MNERNDNFNKYLKLTKKYYYSEKTVKLIKTNRRISISLIFVLLVAGVLSLIVSAFYNNTKTLETVFLPITFSLWGFAIIFAILSAKFYIFIIHRQLKNNELAFWKEAFQIEQSTFIDLTTLKINHKYLEYDFLNESKKYSVTYHKRKITIYYQNEMLFNVNRQWFSKRVGFDSKRLLIARGDIYLNMMDEVALQTQKNINNSVIAIIDNLKNCN